MRISDWSSDVCSSDLEEVGKLEAKVKSFCAIPQVLAFLKDYIVFAEKDEELHKYILRQHQTDAVQATVGRALDPGRSRGLVWHTQGSGKRSEEHTSELQYLMRISYAVFSLKKQKNKQ